MLKPSELQTDSPPDAAAFPDDVVLRVRNVSKKFCRHLKRSMWYGIQDLARNFVGLPPAGVLDASAADLQPSLADAAPDDERSILSDGRRALGLRKHEFTKFGRCGTSASRCGAARYLDGWACTGDARTPTWKAYSSAESILNSGIIFP